MQNHDNCLFFLEVRGGGGVVAAEHQVCLSLLAIVCTGDRTIQNLLENQVSLGCQAGIYILWPFPLPLGMAK